MALERVFGVDTQLIEDGTYFVAEAEFMGAAVLLPAAEVEQRKDTPMAATTARVAKMLCSIPSLRSGEKIRAFSCTPRGCAWGRRQSPRCLRGGCRWPQVSVASRWVPLSLVYLYVARGYREGERRRVPFLGLYYPSSIVDSFDVEGRVAGLKVFVLARA